MYWYKCVRLSRLLAFECTLNHCTFIHFISLHANLTHAWNAWNSGHVTNMAVTRTIMFYRIRFGMMACGSFKLGLHCGNRPTHFRPFLVLWTWPWPDDLHIRTWLSGWVKNEVFWSIVVPVKCMHEMQKCMKFRSHDKYGGHTYHLIRHNQKPMTHPNLVVLSFIEPELLAVEVLHGGNRNFRFFAAVSLTLNRWRSYSNWTRIPWRYT